MKARLTDIKNIVFDLGRVLLNLDFDASIREFQNLGLKNVVTPRQTYADEVFYRLETGLVTPEQFRNRIREILQNPAASDEQIDKAWTAMILDIPANRVNLLLKLKNSYRVILYSNTNKIHIDKLCKDFRDEHGIEFNSLFHDIFYSFEIHDRKPAVSSFEKVIQLSGINPSESLFIDDLEVNIEGARQTGLKTFWLQAGMEICDVL